MEKLVIKFPFPKRSLRYSSYKQPEETKTTKSSNERVKKYRAKLNNDPDLKDKLEKLKEKKRQENKAYMLKVKRKREEDGEFNDMIMEKNRLRMKKLRKLHSEKKRKQNSKKSNAELQKRKSAGSSKTFKQVDSKRKRIERATKSLPNEAGEWAEAMKNILDKASPRRKAKLSLNTGGLNEIHEVLGMGQAGRPRKDNERAKKRLAFSEKASAIWKSPKSLKQYKTRKQAQLNRMSKRSVHRKSWQREIEAFLDDHSRMMPNKKDTIKVDNKVVAKRHLLCSKLELFKKFKNKNPEFDRKFVTFLKMIPKYYKILNITCRRVCVCSKDYNIDQKIEALNKLATKTSHQELKATSRLLSDITLCPYQDLPARTCVDRRCPDCKTSAIQDLYKPLTENSTEELEYHQWQTRPESYTNKDGKRLTANRWVQVKHRTKVEDLVNEVASNMDSFTGHLFRASYQHMMEKNIMSNMPIDQCAVVMDFSENASLQAQDEIESAHWTTKQVTLHPVHIVRHAESSTTENPVLMKESLIFLSDYLTHNSAAVYVFTTQLLLHLKNNPGPCDIKQVHRFTDNCATQYKCKDAFSHLKLLEDVHGIKMVYHYTESGHGKGPSDGLGAAIKKRLERLILGGKVINNAYQAYLALIQSKREHLNQTIIYLPQSKIVKEMPPKDPGIKTVKGTQSFHMVRQHCAGVLDCWDLSCTCMVCIKADQEGPCYFSQYRHEPQCHNILNTKSSRNDVITDSGDGLVSCSSNGQNDDAALNQTMVESIVNHNEHVSSNANQMHLFSSSIASKGWQIRNETPQDGNCAFWALSDQLDRTGGNPYTHTQLRENVVNFIDDLPESDKVNLSKFLDRSVESYLQGMRCDGTYADHVCLQSVSKMLSVEVLIVHAQLQDIKLGPTSAASNKNILVLGYIPELQHYVSLEPLYRFEPEDFVAVILSGDRRRRIYIAKVLQIDQEDVKLRFLQASRPAGIYLWPETDDIAWQPQTDVLKKLTRPKLLPGRGLKMKFNVNELQCIR